MANHQPNISLILPAYNEARTICSTLTQVTSYFRGRGLTHQIIVSADGDDGTRELAGAFGRENGSVEVIGEPVRRGKGRGIRDAVRIATGEIVGFADADNKVPIEEFERVEPWLKGNEDYDIVIGSRGLKESRIERKQRWYRTYGSKAFYYFMHAVVGMPGIEDTQCGFKFFRGQVAKDLFSRQRIDGYMFDVEVLALAQRLGYRMKEVPIRWRDDGDTRLQLVAGNIRNVLDIFKIRRACSRVERVESRARARAMSS
ncbi:MAG TPA: dolichyl-phosphate beta-glucosyltransferase [Bryobacteraceae bacterium]|nr:dolichyl-phosphate beta-glucosyltransferase [Bryobacteraceae bacterium]HZU43575.1 dolichyl-phosphate beta-glucosyltransferase [Terriglobales bacterium]